MASYCKEHTKRDRISDCLVIQRGILTAAPLRPLFFCFINTGRAMIPQKCTLECLSTTIIHTESSRLCSTNWIYSPTLQKKTTHTYTHLLLHASQWEPRIQELAKYSPCLTFSTFSYVTTLIQNGLRLLCSSKFNTK